VRIVTNRKDKRRKGKIQLLDARGFWTAGGSAESKRSPAAQETAVSQLEIKRREKRKAYLKNLSSDFPKAWASVKEPVERGSGRGYDEACRMLVDIAEAYDLFANRGEQFQKELEKFMAGYLRRKSLIQRLVKAGIWRDQ
jgi:hypothetical protein